VQAPEEKLPLTPEDAPVVMMNRRQRRLLMRQVRREYSAQTRFWRRAWRGVMPQSQVVNLVKSRHGKPDDYPGPSTSVRRQKLARKAFEERRPHIEAAIERRSMVALIDRARGGVA